VNVDGNVSVAAMAEVKGSIAAGNVTVAGTVEGDISSTDTLTVDPDAKILGDMTGPRVHIAEGATVRGMVRTEGEPRRVAPERLSRQDVAYAQPKRKPEVRLAPPPPAPAPSEAMAPVYDEPPRDKPKKRKDKDKKKKKRPPEPIVPVLAKRTKGKKKGEKRAR
jgi:hypothetical protein